MQWNNSFGISDEAWRVCVCVLAMEIVIESNSVLQLKPKSVFAKFIQPRKSFERGNNSWRIYTWIYLDSNEKEILIHILL